MKGFKFMKRDANGYKLHQSGKKTWRNSAGQCHRTDGPAKEYADGDKAWYFNNQRHRTDGPAVEYVNGDKEWWVNGQPHRTDGPAVERANGGKEYWYEGERISKKKYYSKEFQVCMVMEG